MEKKAEISWMLSDDKSVAALFLTLPDGKRVPVRPYTAAQLEQSLALMGQLRSEMQPPVSFDPPPESEMRAVYDPRFEVGLVPETGTRRLRIGHPQLGWLLIEMPAESVTQLVAALTARPTRLAPTSGGTLPN